MRTALAGRQAETYQIDATQMLKDAESSALEVLRDEDTLKRLCARRCERRLRDQVARQTPSWKALLDAEAIQIEVTSPLPEEISRYRALMNDGDIDGLIARYPVRESSALQEIAKKLQFRDKSGYEQAALARLVSEENLAEDVRGLLGSLSNALLSGNDAVVSEASGEDCS